MSVRAQDDPEWTLLVVIDGPELPDVEAWLDGLQDARIRHTRNSTNLGISGNFQRCLELTSESHVMFLGCDDALLPTYVSVVRKVLGRFPEADVVQPGVEVMDDRGQSILPMADRIKRLIAPNPDPVRILTGERLVASLMLGNWTYFPSLCWRRDPIAALGFRSDLQITLDLAMIMRVLLDGGRLVVTPDVTFRYRRHPSSASSVAARQTDRFDEEARLFVELAGACRLRGWHRASRAARWHVTSRLNALTHTLAAARSGDGLAVRRLLRHAATP